MKKFLLLVAIAALGLASCTDNQIEENLASKPISFNSMIGKNGNLKASELLTSAFTSFNVYAYSTGTVAMATTITMTPYISNLNVARTDASSPWGYTGDLYYWPQSDNLQFFAYNGAITGWTVPTTGVLYPYFNYTIPATQEDLVVSSAVDKTNILAALNLTFSHALTQINFSLQGDVAGHTYKVKEIKLENVKNTGKFTYPSTWSGQGGNTSYIYFTGNKDVTNSGFVSFGNGSGIAAAPITGNEALMLMPQALGTVKISVKYDVINPIGANVVVDKIATVTLSSGSWGMGTKVRYKLTLPIGTNPITFTADVTPWNADTETPIIL